MIFGATMAVVLTPIVALVGAMCYRDVRAFQLRERLRALSPEQRAEALQPLMTESWDAAKTAKVLLRYSPALPAEITPAPPLAGRGDELTAEREA